MTMWQGIGKTETGHDVANPGRGLRWRNGISGQGPESNRPQPLISITIEGRSDPAPQVFVRLVSHYVYAANEPNQKEVLFF